MKIAEASDPQYTSRFEPVGPARPVSPIVPIQPTPLQPVFSPFSRCPLPQISSSPDSLRQFYIGGVVPQTRLIPAKSLTN